MRRRHGRQCERGRGAPRRRSASLGGASATTILGTRILDQLPRRGRRCRLGAARIAGCVSPLPPSWSTRRASVWFAPTTTPARSRSRLASAGSDRRLPRRAGRRALAGRGRRGIRAPRGARPSAFDGDVGPPEASSTSRVARRRAIFFAAGSGARRRKIRTRRRDWRDRARRPGSRRRHAWARTDSSGAKAARERRMPAPMALADRHARRRRRLARRLHAALWRKGGTSLPPAALPTPRRRSSAHAAIRGPLRGPAAARTSTRPSRQALTAIADPDGSL